MITFGETLRLCRQSTRNRKRRNKYLTQQEFVEALSDLTAGRVNYSAAALSNWENDLNVPRADDRDLLVGLVQVLERHGGVSSLQDANALLQAGHYRQLQPSEIKQVNPAWLDEFSTHGLVPPLPAVSPWLIFLYSLRHLFVEMKNARYRSPGRPRTRSNTETILLLACWLGAALLVWQFALPLLYWPLRQPLEAVLTYAGATILITALVALVVWLDQRRYWPALHAPGGAGYLWTLGGALTGFHACYLVIFLFFLIANDLELSGLGDTFALLQFIVALLIVAATVLGAREVPLAIMKIFPAVPFSRADAIMLSTLLLIGPVVGWAFYSAHTFLLANSPAAISLAVLLAVVFCVLTLFEQRRTGSGTLPAYAWALVFGLLWTAYAAAGGLPSRTVVVAATVLAVVAALWVWEMRRA